MGKTDAKPRKEIEAMDHIEILGKAVGILRDRNEQYGDVGEVFSKACSIFELTTGQRISRHKAAMFLHCLKLARMHKSPMKLDNYMDGINYMAFAAQFTNELLAEDMVDDGVREMAAKLAPQTEG